MKRNYLFVLCFFIYTIAFGTKPEREISTQLIFMETQVMVDSICGWPAPAADSCYQAPLFCGEFLDGYCSNNGLATLDTIGNLADVFGCAIDNNEWLRIFPCDTIVELAIQVSNCGNNGGLEVALFEKIDSFTFASVYGCQLIANGTTDTLVIENLIPGSIYHLMIDGLAGDTCDYEIDVISGISLSPPQFNEISPGYIDGPGTVCLGEEATYTIVPGEFEIISDDGCPVPAGACGSGGPSGLNLVWHTPDFLQILGDSINVFSINTATPALNDSILTELFGFDITDTFGTFVDTIFGQVYITYEIDTTTNDTMGVDTITSTVFCSCSGVSSVIGPKDVMMIIKVTNNPPIEICEGDCVSVCGATYCEGAIVYCEGTMDCEWIRQSIIVKPWDYYFESATICEGESYFFFGQNYDQPGQHYVIDLASCIEFELDLTVLSWNTNSFTVEICAGDCFEFCGQSYCQSGVYSCPSPNDPCTMDELELIVLPPVINDLGLVSLCEGSCFTFNNEDYCEEGNYEVPVQGQTCEEIFLFSIEIDATDSLQLSPVIRECDATNSNYTVSFSILNGLPPYIVNGLSISGNSFLSSPIPNWESYHFEIKDSDACTSYAYVDGTYDCGPFCQTNAGEMSPQELPSCKDQELIANHLGGEVLNIGDTAEYILHTSSDASLGTILDRNSNGIFSFIPGLMEYGVTYYASYIVGQSFNGQIDTGHVCFAIAPGQPMVFYEEATVDIQTSMADDEEVVRLGQSIVLSAETNIDPSQITWTNEQGEVLESNGLSLEIRPLRGGVYTISVENEVGCFAMDEILVRVSLDPHIFIPNAFTPNSDGVNDSFFIYTDDSVEQINSLQVFNRLGGLVFSRSSFVPNEPALGWDGRYNGKLANSDVFVYKAEVLLANGDKTILSGDVILLR